MVEDQKKVGVEPRRVASLMAGTAGQMTLPPSSNLLNIYNFWRNIRGQAGCLHLRRPKKNWGRREETSSTVDDIEVSRALTRPSFPSFAFPPTTSSSFPRMAQNSHRSPLPQILVPGGCPSTSRLDFVLGKHKSFDSVPPPPSASLAPSHSFTALSNPFRLSPTAASIPAASLLPPSPSGVETTSSESDTSSSSATSSVAPRALGLSPLPLRYPLSSQSSGSSYDDEQEEMRLVPLHKRPLAEWSSTAGIRLNDQATALRKGREVRKSNRDVSLRVSGQLSRTRTSQS